MTSDAPWQVLSDCPHCRCEAAVIEWMDPRHPACHLGVPAEKRCRLCAWTVVAKAEPFAPRVPGRRGRCPACNDRLSPAAMSGEAPCPHCGYAPTVEQTGAPEDVSDPHRARAALARWAREEGTDDVADFCTANMGVEPDEAVALLSRGEVVATTFDVIAFLFPGGAGGGAAGAGDRPAVIDREPEPEPAPADDLEGRPTEMDPRTPARFLVSVMVADGALRAGERTFVTRWLTREGLPQLEPDDLRLWRPAEVGPPPPPELAERLLEAAVHLMHLDRERDGSEWRVIQAFARAWRIPEYRVRDWDRRYDRKYRSPMAALFRVLDRLNG